MAAMAEGRMNLAALQQRDPYITDIVDTASQVALYSFSPKDNEWEKTDIEGTLFVYSRSASPINGFMILNRLGLNDLIEPINKNLEFQLQDPFLLYRNSALAIFGIWFYDKDECARLGQLMNSLVQLAADNHSAESDGAGIGRQRRASESDSMIERTENFNMKQPVDIMQMLSKAQDEYNRSKSTAPRAQKVRKGAEPKPMIDNPSASATRSTNLHKPQPMKMKSSSEEENKPAEPAAPNTQISLEALFRRASIGQQATNTTAVPSIVAKSQTAGADSTAVTASRGMHPTLQRLMSNPGATVEEIERQHRAEAAAPPPLLPHIAMSRSPDHSQQNGDVSHSHPHLGQLKRDSPNTELKRTLNILPQSAVTTTLVNTSRQVSQTFSDSVGVAKESTLYGIISTTKASKVTGQTGQLSNLPGPATQPLLSSGQPSALLPGQQAAYSPGPLQQQQQQQTGSYSLLGNRTDSCGSIKCSEELVTPGALSQSSSKAALSTAVSSLQQQVGNNVLLSPMAFQTPGNRRVTPPIAGSQPNPPTFHLASSDGSASDGSSPPGPGKMGVVSAAQAEEPPQLTPLTKEQMQQAMLYLIKNDPGFLVTLHEAYIKSLNSGLTSWKQ